jgi:thiol-disulfide isomerase/thioredoxin
MNHLLEFYGTECPHCVRMDGLVAKLEKETGAKVEKLEIWHNSTNEKKMGELDRGFCGGVPFFYNTKTDKWICGEDSYETLKDWALE